MAEKPSVYIDGKEGTTGLQIYERLGRRQDVRLLLIDDEKRKDTQERRKYLNEADLVFLCLPDDAARQAVSLIENDRTRVIDASTAHRTAPDWVYGFAELFPEQRERIRGAKRLANPGCHATGFLAGVAPLVRAGVIPAEYPVCCYSLTGYSGGGKKLIAEYEAPEREAHLKAPAPYALGLNHKHLPEMQAVAGLTYPPLFSPVLGDIDQGMATVVLLESRLLGGHPTAREIHALLTAHYAGQPLVRVTPFDEASARLPAGRWAGFDGLELVVTGHGEQIMMTTLLDNLGKGAAGAAVQNMNLMLGLGETEGLLLPW